MFTGRNEALDFHIDNPLSLGYARTSDGMFAYLNDDAGIYRFSLATKRGTRLADLVPGGGRNQGTAVNLSHDERRLYYVVNKAGGDEGPYVDDLYEYDLGTGTRTKLMNLQSAVGGGVKFSGGHMMSSTGKALPCVSGRGGARHHRDRSVGAGLPPSLRLPGPFVRRHAHPLKQT